jgi:thiopeptide-type bacteriocin biosynthesis protein
MPPSTPHHVTESHVLAVLTGTPLEQTAAQIPMDPADLADAVEAYRAAGRTALETQVRHREWFQVRIQFTSWTTAEETAAVRLGPRLQQAQEAGLLTGWWFLRKYPYWRLRCRPGPKSAAADMPTIISSVLDDFVADGTVDRWQESIYEPEELAFGGAPTMDISHDLFHADSHGTLTYLRHHDPTVSSEQNVGRREMAIVLCTALFRGARQDDHEQGDFWHRVAQLRSLAAETPSERLRGMIPGLKRLMALDTSPTSTLFAADGPLPLAVPWAEAFAVAGRHLADAARDGTLERGLRDVLAHHVIFHFNRLGLPADAQAVLARAAREALLNPPHDSSGK